MDKIKCTAIVHTRNAEKYLEEVILHLHDYAEVMVVDMDSSDSTLDIADRMGCRIEKVSPCGYADPARHHAMKIASYDWVFFVDADEIIPTALTEWIRDFIAATESDAYGELKDVKGVGVARKNLLLDEWNIATYPDYQIRLLNKNYSKWPPEVHSKPVVDGKRYLIPKERHELAMIHKSPTISEMLERLNRYTSLEMERKKNMKISWFKLLTRPWVRFFKSFILKGGFRKGKAGYISAMHDAMYQHYYMAKIMEYQLARKKMEH